MLCQVLGGKVKEGRQRTLAGRNGGGEGVLRHTLPGRGRKRGPSEGTTGMRKEWSMEK